MRFRLFRFRTFWFGVPGLVFLLWAWADSMKVSTRAVIVRKSILLSDSVYHHAGSLDFVHWPNSWGGSLWPRQCRVTRQRSDAHGWFPLPGIRGHSVWIGTAFHTSRLVIPHWCLVSLYLIAWAGLIGWRWRTVRRALRQSPAA
ncbi:MAG: hypothetical protein EOP83_00545 [Verrucomicrobiaceae bacterium]|nr:MAG: hypothetical protein EOP83_00545 [Verrucomicrobiaceae bacterium]